MDYTNVIVICGVKNSGKTTLMEKLIRRFSKDGLKVASIKHDGHDFEGDVAGTDSYKHHKAGAYASAVFSENRIMVIKDNCKEDEKDIMNIFPEADLVLIEGLKNSSYPKIEVVRNGVSKELVSDSDSRFLVVSDIKEYKWKDKTLFIDDIDGICHEIRYKLNLWVKI